jgi:hypothetical protein
MSDIDRQRVTAVRTLQEMGYLFRDGDWVRGQTSDPVTVEADRLHALLIKLVGIASEPREAGQLEEIAEAVKAYEVVRWPDGKVPGGKG